MSASSQCQHSWDAQKVKIWGNKKRFILDSYGDRIQNAIPCPGSLWGFGSVNNLNPQKQNQDPSLMSLLFPHTQELGFCALACPGSQHKSPQTEQWPSRSPGKLISHCFPKTPLTTLFSNDKQLENQAGFACPPKER